MKTDDVVNAFGVLAEMASILRDRLVENGFTRDEAVMICSRFISTSVSGRREEDDAAD